MLFCFVSATTVSILPVIDWGHDLSWARGAILAVAGGAVLILDQNRGLGLNSHVFA